jgi:bifunctional non-homologous end joining protein LigD
MSLNEYRHKRDFAKTREPRGGRGKARTPSRFVVQKHQASRLHYDFRLEIDDALKSWAVPKGIPFARGEKRLAVEVEDHPVSYINFEGTIPKGQYGGGTVMVWDKGSFKTKDGRPRQGLSAGKLRFELKGTKLRGEWSLVRMRDSKQWLLIRSGESSRPISKRRDDTSALSGKTMKQLSAAGENGSTKPRRSKDPRAVTP